jgi:hypothetical protein
MVSQYDLGLLSANGQSVLKDYLFSHIFLNIAAANRYVQSGKLDMPSLQLCVP